MNEKYAKESLEELFQQEILALNHHSKPLVYQLVEGKFKVYYVKRQKMFCYTIDGYGVEERATKEEILACLLGFVSNQDEATIKAVLKSRESA